MFLFLDDERQVQDVQWNVQCVAIENNTKDKVWVQSDNYQKLAQQSNVFVFKNPFWFIEKAKEALINGQELILSFDHDIAWGQGDSEITGYSTIQLLSDELVDLFDKSPNKVEFQHAVLNTKVFVHSKNMIGAENIVKYWIWFINRIVIEWKT